VDGLNVRDSRVHDYPPRRNAAPSQELLVIRRNHKTGEISLDPLRQGLIPYWCKDPTGGRKRSDAPDHRSGDYARWLGDELDPHDLMRPFPAVPMRMWPISTRVNKPENDDPSIVDGGVGHTCGIAARILVLVPSVRSDVELPSE
jgi:putative SOS response-associated peptidase YedK